MIVGGGPNFRVGPWLLGATILLGASLRLIWPDTIEFKQDEAWLYRLVADHCANGEWTALGMPSSQHVKIPGLSVWVFYPLGHLFGVDDPTCLARGVEWCSIATLLGLVAFAYRCVPAAEREPWLWAAALIAVNPVAVIFQRKLWPPCMLPGFCLLFLIGWWHRDRRWGALAWGMVGAMLGQIHATGFLFALSVLLTTVAAGRFAARWGYWLVGSVLGTLPMTAWLLYLVHGRDPVKSDAIALHRWIEGKFWLQWVTEPLGVGLRGIFGGDYEAFLRWPLVGGQPTYAGAVLQVLAGLFGVAIFALAMRGSWSRRGHAAKPGGVSSSELLIRAGSVCFGLMLTLAAVRFYRHYLIITFPLMSLWLARLALPDGVVGRQRVLGRRLLASVCAVNALSCLLVLSYLHANGGAPNGSFNTSYEARVRESGSRVPPIKTPFDESGE